MKKLLIAIVLLCAVAAVQAQTIWPRSTIKTWFETGDKPTQEQYWRWMDSYWHKEDSIPVGMIQGLDTADIGSTDTLVYIYYDTTSKQPLNFVDSGFGNLTPYNGQNPVDQYLNYEYIKKRIGGSSTVYDSSTQWSVDTVLYAYCGCEQEGHSYLIGEGATGAYEGFDNYIMQIIGGVPNYTAADEGDYLAVQEEDNPRIYKFEDGEWNLQSILVEAGGNYISIPLDIGPKNSQTLRFKTKNIVRERINPNGDHFFLKFKNKVPLRNYTYIDSATGQFLVDTLHDLTLTTTGTSGPATLAGNVLNIPEYSGGGGGASAFTDLTDVPSSYSGQALKILRVNSGATGVEFVNAVPTANGGVPAGGGAAQILAKNSATDYDYAWQNGLLRTNTLYSRYLSLGMWAMKSDSNYLAYPRPITGITPPYYDTLTGILFSQNVQVAGNLIGSGCYFGTTRVNPLIIQYVTTNTETQPVYLVRRYTLDGNNAQMEMRTDIATSRPLTTYGSTPTYTLGTGAGTGATASITGNDAAGLVTINLGTTSTSGDVITITFSAALTNTPKAITLTPANDISAAEAAGVYVDAATASTTAFKIKCSTTQTGSATQKWYYTVTQ